MISVITHEKCYELRGLSTDTKPIEGIGNGSIFLEMDTLKLWFFDGASKVWIEAGAEPNTTSN